ncbi:hypothetical protein Enr13x_09760 [Stieleria neptunia]|uniref:Uncharacterized protein n=1 Tax=Stieleria neptunia TaxID=2527979 RepID=A0A518HJW6_9BACT|nr:hypothetical protein Enr13x_09760 [Stieleria neptunia]
MLDAIYNGSEFEQVREQLPERLSAAEGHVQVSLQIDGFAKFADYFFDGLISDWIVQSKIQKAKVKCSETLSRVKTAIRQCKSRLDSVCSEIEILTERKCEKPLGTMPDLLCFRMSQL